MTVVRVKGFQFYKDRHGKPRCYHRATRTPIDLAATPVGSIEFFAECERIVASTKKTAPKPGGLGKLIVEYRAHAAFKDLAPTTRADYQKIFDWLAPIAEHPSRVSTDLWWCVSGTALPRRGDASPTTSRRCSQ